MKLFVLIILTLTWTIQIKGNTTFTPDLYRRIAKTNDGNIIFSPFSLEIVMSLAQSGAKCKTGEEIRTVFHLPNTTENTESVFKQNLTDLKKNANDTLQFANKIYIRKNYKIKEDFKEVSVDVYQAESESLDFSQNVQAANVINQWVENHTNHKIQNIVDPKSLGSQTVALLVNALHFKDSWLVPFSNTATIKKNFYKNDNSVIQVDTMHLRLNRIGYYEDEDAKFLKLPFKNQHFSMIFVLPNDRQGIKCLQAQADKVFTFPEFRYIAVHIALPKFKIENTFQFKDILIKMGISRAFSSNADFSGIGGKKGDLFISDVVQKAFIDVNENGVEASAATVVGISTTSVVQSIDFIADHPFIYYMVYDDIILFAGRVSEPKV